jgi:hypothetical protein
MRQIGFLVGGNAFRQPGIPTVSQFIRRRMEDDIEDIFYKACAAKDIERAGDLLGLLEKMHARRSVSYGRERRLNTATLDRARQKLRQLA